MNLNALDLNLLKVFDAMLRTGNTTLAGEHVGLTQSAISNALKRMRQIFNDPLFVLSAQGMRPTPAAQRMAVPIQAALAQIRLALEDRGQFDPKVSERGFRLYLSDVGQMYFLPPLLAALRAEAPQIALETLEMPPRDAQQLMAAGDIDLALGPLAAFGEGYHRQHLLDEYFVCLVRREHPFIGDELSLDQYLRASHIIYRPKARSSAPLDDAVEKMCVERGIRRHVALTLSHSLGLARMTTHSDFVTVVPSRLARSYVNYPDLRVLPLPFEWPSYEISQQWHGRVQKDPGHAWLRARIASLFKEGAGDAGEGMAAPADELPGR